MRCPCFQRIFFGTFSMYIKYKTWRNMPNSPGMGQFIFFTIVASNKRFIGRNPCDNKSTYIDEDSKTHCNYNLPKTPDCKYNLPETPGSKFNLPETPDYKYNLTETPGSKYSLPETPDCRLYNLPETPGCKYNLPETPDCKYNLTETLTANTIYPKLLTANTCVYKLTILPKLLTNTQNYFGALQK